MPKKSKKAKEKLEADIPKCGAGVDTSTSATLGVGVAVSRSIIGVDGLFAMRAFRPGEIVSEYGGTFWLKEDLVAQGGEHWYLTEVPGHDEVVLDGEHVAKVRGAPAAQWINDPLNQELTNVVICYTPATDGKNDRAGAIRESRVPGMPAESFPRLWMRATKQINPKDEIYFAYGNEFWGPWIERMQMTPIVLGMKNGAIAVVKHSEEVVRVRGKKKKPPPPPDDRLGGWGGIRIKRARPLGLKGVVIRQTAIKGPRKKKGIKVPADKRTFENFSKLLTAVWNEHTKNAPNTKETWAQIRTTDRRVLDLQRQAKETNPNWYIPADFPPRFVQVVALDDDKESFGSMLWKSLTVPFRNLF